MTTASLKAKGRDVAVYNALVRTALAAVNAHWDYSEWHAELDKRSSHLGNQAATKRNRENRPREQLEKMLQKAWDAAVVIAAERPPFDEEARAAHVAKFRTWLSDPACPVSENQRLVLDAVARRAAVLNVTSPSCSTRYLLGETGLGLTALRTALRRCLDAGLLVQLEKGQPWAKSRSRASCRAAVYRLPPVEALPAVNQCPASGASGAPSMVLLTSSTTSEPLTSDAPRSAPTTKSDLAPLASGAPLSIDTSQKEEQMTLKELVQAHALIAEVKAELLAQLRAELGLGTSSGPEATVRPLRAVREGRT
ncbi:hypothetical protein [Modestobacter sp. I12A-02662]|uniref:hypothetical protein n=1 Tax=Modestobacter sp. I12A-02662 TaxID=1730496 RepID=UPI0034DF1E7B